MPGRSRRLPAAVMGLALLCALPWPVAAADASAPPDASPGSEPAPSTEPAPSAQPTPSVPSDPGPSAAPTPTPTPTPAPDPERVTIQLNLYRSHSVARQFTSYWCVPANVMTMLNTVTGRRDRSYATQLKYDRWLKRYNRYRYRTRGNDVQGWATMLDYSLPGPLHYDDRSFSTQGQAISRIVEALDRTRHPVGVVVDRGTHAWTVLGYRATVVPGQPATRTIIGLYVSGSLLSDPHPYRYLTIGDFRRRFTRYHEWQRSVIWEGRYVIVSE